MCAEDFLADDRLYRLQCIERLGLSVLQQARGLLQGVGNAQVLFLLIDAMEELLHMSEGQHLPATAVVQRVEEAVLTDQRMVRPASVAQKVRVILALSSISDQLTLFQVGEKPVFAGLATALSMFACSLRDQLQAPETQVV